MDRDYISPNLAVVTPDAAFPHMRAGDRLAHPWRYLRRDVSHIWYADERFPLMGFLNRDEAILLHNIALQFEGKRALEIGSWLGWSTAHLALAGVTVDVIDPAHADAAFRAIVENSLAHCGALDRVYLTGSRSPEGIGELGRKWSLFFIDGDHEGASPLRDTLECLHYAEDDCAFVFHDLASPDVAAGVLALRERGFHTIVYQTAQIMAMAWRGDITPVEHIPDPEVTWQIPQHLLDLYKSNGMPRTRAPYRRLGDRQYDDQGGPVPKVCIVTNEIIGPFKNGGIGTSMTGLAETLAAGGIPVTVLYTGAIWTPGTALQRWKKHYADRGIELAALSLTDMKSLEGPVRDCGFGVPYLVYQWLKSRSFDVVHFNDCCGDGSLALAAKRVGIAFGKTLFVVALHSPSQWVLELNQTLPAGPLLAAFNYAERLSVQCADVLWSPSRYMLEWARAHDFTLPHSTFVQQYSIPNSGAPAPPPAHGRSRKPQELVFFGRLEERKGLRLFCNTIDSLRHELAQREIAVTFMGKPAFCEGMESLRYIAHRSAQWRFLVKTLANLGQQEALAYLAAGPRLAVIASPEDNSPCTVYEALAAGIPFLAARTGGIPELVAEGEKVLFDHSIEGLRAALLDAIEHGGWIVTPATTQEETRRSWLSMHAHWKSFLPAPRPPQWRDLRLSVIVDHRAGRDLDRTMKSLESCERLRKVVVLDRNKGEAAVNRALEDMAGDAVLLVQSGTSIRSGPMAMMLGDLDREGLDALVPAAESGEKMFARTIPPLGGSPSFSLLHGVAFTGGLLVRGTTLLKAKGTKPLIMDSDFCGLADLCVANGVQVWPWPEPVFDLPLGRRARTHDAGPARLHAYNDSPPAERYYMLAMNYSAAHLRLNRKRELAIALIELGVAPIVHLGSRALGAARRIRSRFRQRWSR